MTPDEVDAIMETWSLEEAVRINRDVLGGLKAGWVRGKSPSGREGFRGVVRKGRKVVWRSVWVSIDMSPCRALSDAHDEQERQVFAAWKAEKGIR